MEAGQDLELLWMPMRESNPRPNSYNNTILKIVLERARRQRHGE